MTPAKILCPFCGAAWSEHAVAKWEDEGSYDACGRGYPIVCITITCDACARVMYEKDGVEHDWSI